MTFSSDIYTQEFKKKKLINVDYFDSHVFLTVEEEVVVFLRLQFSPDDIMVMSLFLTCDITTSQKVKTSKKSFKKKKRFKVQFVNVRLVRLLTDALQVKGHGVGGRPPPPGLFISCQFDESARGSQGFMGNRNLHPSLLFKVMEGVGDVIDMPPVSA